MPSISLVSLNIEMSKHLDLIAPFLAERMPDVVCVQELFERDIQTLSDVLGGAPFIFAPMTRRADPRGGSSVMGVGIFSRIPIRHMHTPYYHGDSTRIPDFDFTSAETKSNTENHPVVLCDVEKDGHIFRIGTTHFTWTPDGQPSEQQRIDLQALFAALDGHQDLILTGDFNAPRGGEIFAAFAERYKDNIPPHYTTSIDGSLHRAGPLEVMIDGLFTTPDYQVSDVELIPGLSDHCAIVATISRIV